MLCHLIIYLKMNSNPIFEPDLELADAFSNLFFVIIMPSLIIMGYFDLIITTKIKYLSTLIHQPPGISLMKVGLMREVFDYKAGVLFYIIFTIIRCDYELPFD